MNGNIDKNPIENTGQFDPHAIFDMLGGQIGAIIANIEKPEDRARACELYAQLQFHLMESLMERIEECPRTDEEILSDYRLAMQKYVEQLLPLYDVARKKFNAHNN